MGLRFVWQWSEKTEIHVFFWCEGEFGVFIVILITFGFFIRVYAGWLVFNSAVFYLKVCVISE